MHGWQARVLAIAVVGLGALGVAAMAVAEDRQVHHTAAGQAAAKAVVLRRADLGATPGWTGGTKKPDNTPDPSCAGYDPKQSDLVEIGDVETNWENHGLTLDSEASVMQTPNMVRLDWQRSVLDPDLLPCLRKALAKALPKTAHVVSGRRVAFPALATYSRAFRFLIDMSTTAGKVRLFTDVVVLGRGQTEITLTTLAPNADVRVVQAAEVRLAVIMLLRVRM
jgi:hypothetical protein